MIHVPQETTLGQVARIMEREAATALVVTDADDTPVGVITDRHLLSAMAASRHPDAGTAGSWMAPVVIDEHGTRTLPDTDTGHRVAIRARDRAGSR
jgi:CBS domain-containing protein